MKQWTHEAHLIVGLWHNINYEFETAVDLVSSRIKAYNLAVGTQNTDDSGYHETITLASLRAIRAFLNGTDRPIFETVNRFLASKYGRSDWILDYWSKDVLFSTKARRDWVEPDKQPLPF